MSNENSTDCKILVFAVEVPPSMSGSGRSAYFFAKQLSRQTTRTTLCHLNYNGKSAAQASDEKLVIRRFTYHNQNLFKKIVSFLPLLFNYLKSILQNDIILVYSGYLIGFQFIILVSAVFKKKVIFRSTLLNGDDASTLLNKGPLLKKLNSLALKNLTYYFSINPEFTFRFRMETCNRIPVFESLQGVDIQKFHPVGADEKREVRNSLGFKPDEIVILSVGNLLKRKAYHLIIPKLAKINFRFRYVIAGEFKATVNHRITKKENDEMEELYRLGIDLLGEAIVFTGPVENIQEYFYAADLFLHGSVCEGTPNALIEAMACGIPSLVYKLPGISGFLTRHGINAFEFENHEKLELLIENILSHPENMEQIGTNAAKDIREKHTFEIVATNFLKEIYA
jgi:glycosyltransferase involved in cell wall biosynthesis